MKKITFFVLTILLFSCVSLYAQQDNVKRMTQVNQDVFELTNETIQSINTTGFARCLTDENEIALQKEFPNRSTTQQFEDWIAPKIAQIKADRLAGRSSQAVFNIPVVIHIIHDGDAVGTGENITDAQALSQIQVMNEDFRRLTGTRGGANTTGLAVDVELNFCIAQVDESGAPTTGVIRHNITPYSNDVTDGAGGPDWEVRTDVQQMKTTTQWDPTKYLNMWTIRPGGLSLMNGGLSGLLGYAQFPDNTPNLPGLNTTGGAANTDGVVAAFDAMGTLDANDGTFILNPTYNLGRTMTHEVGHWLGLRHIWGDGDCTADDFCADTPNAGNPNYTCNLSADSCTGSAGNDMVQNYMDYTNDACMDTFTQNQKDRIQAIMAASPRRMELNTSNGCSIEPTVYIASTLPSNIVEGSDCNFTDIVVDLGVSTGASASATVVLTNTGTATENEDFEFINNSVTIAQGATTGSNSVTLRIYNDGFVEASETIILGVNVTTTGDAVATASTNEIGILNDDEVVSEMSTVTYFSDDFNDEDISDWTLTDSDGDGNNWGDIFAVGDGAGGFVTPVSLISRSWQNNVPLTPDNWVVSPAIDLSSASGVINLSYITQVAAQSWDEEKYSVHVGTTNDISVLVNSATSLTEVLGDAGNTGTPTPHIIDISALAGQPQVYVAFRHWDCTDEDFLSIDDVAVMGDVTTSIQTDVNAATAASNNLNGAGTAYYSDTASNNIILDIDNTAGFDYGCTTAEVSRDTATAGADAVMYSATDPSTFVTAKTFDITSINPNTSDVTSISFYFTEAEIAGWETVTGNSRTSLYAKNDDTADVSAITITSFGSGHRLTGSFDSGVAGTFYFGTQNALLSIDDFSLNNTFEIYPNPNNGQFNIQFTSVSNNIEIAVYDVRGRSVYNKLYNNSGTFNENINIGNVQSGLYLLNVNDGERTITKKIIVE
ncbi:T9SS type A sorting domain-containing protein [Lacinutrix chionoecetis]